MLPNATACSTTSREVASRRLIKLPEVLDRTAIGRTAWLVSVKKGQAPKPVRMGRAVAWVEAEVDAWIADRIAAR